jgi:alanine-synthesizing transaminase
MKQIDLGLGSPMDPPPAAALDRFIYEMRQRGGNGYAPLNGELEAREAVCEWKETRFGVTGLDPNVNVTFGEGSRLLLVSAFEILFRSGDKIILPSRYYNGHMAAIMKFDLKPILVSMHDASAYIDGIEDLLHSGIRPKAVVTCFVSNPTGMSCEANDYARLVELAHAFGFVILDDYAYGGLDFKQGYIPSILAFSNALEVVLFFGTTSKMFSTAAWKVGFVVGLEERISLITKNKSCYSEGGPKPAQLATATALRECAPYVDQIRNTYHQRAETTTSLLRRAGMIGARMPDGGMFGWYEVPSDYPGGSIRLTQKLAERGVIVRDDQVYGGEGTHIRWCLNSDDEDTRSACGHVAEVLAEK